MAHVRAGRGSGQGSLPWRRRFPTRSGAGEGEGFGGGRRHPTGGGCSSTLNSGRSARAMGSWRAADGRTPAGLTRTPGAAGDHGVVTVRTKRGGLGKREGFGWFQLGAGRLPGGALGPGQEGGLLEEGADAVEFDAGGGVQPTEAADAMEAGGQDVLEEATDEFVRLQVEVLPATRGALPIAPAHPAIGEQREVAVAGGGLEDVAAQVTESVFAGTGGLAVDDPALLPEAGGQGLEEVGGVAFQGLTKEGAVMISQGMDVDEELGAAGNPLALIEAQAAGGDQVVHVGMVDEGAAPGVEDAEHAQGGTQALGVAGQILERLSRGGKEEVQAQLRVRAHPGAQGFGHRERDQEVGDREQQAGVVDQPGVGVGLAALGTMAVIAGVVGVMERAAVRASVEFAAQSGSATGKEPFEHLALTPGHGGAEPFQVSWPPVLEQLVETDRVTAGPRRTGPRHGRGSEIGHESIQAFLMLGATEGGQVGVDDGGGGAFVTEVDLELAEVLALLEQVGCIAVPKAMDMGLFLDAAGLEGEAEGALEGGAAHRLGGGGSALAVVAFGGEEQAGMAMGFPAFAQQEQGALGQGDVAIPVALAGTDVEEHAPGIDVADFQMQGFAQAQAAGVEGGEGDAVIEGGHRGEDLAHLGHREDDGELELGCGADQFDLGGPGAAEGFLPEHLDGADGLGGTGTGEATLGFEVEEVLAQLLGRDLLGGFVEVLGELADASEVGLLATRQQGQEAQVVGEAD